MSKVSPQKFKINSLKNILTAIVRSEFLVLSLAIFVIVALNPGYALKFGFSLLVIKTILILSFHTTFFGVLGIVIRSLLAWRCSLIFSIVLMFFVAVTFYAQGLFVSSAMAIVHCYSSLLKALQVVSSNIFNPEIGHQFDSFDGKQLVKKDDTEYYHDD